jgi:hypothetical protein
MTQTNYERDRSAEYYVKHLLESMGYRFIIRSAGSHTPIDLLVARVSSYKVERLAIQAKGWRKGRISGAELRELRDWAMALDATPIFTRKERGKWLLIDVD